ASRDGAWWEAHHAGGTLRDRRLARPRGGGGMTEQFDVITMGRIGVDVYPLQVGVSLREVKTFGKYLGGSATNVAVAAARYRRRRARPGRDPGGAGLLGDRHGPVRRAQPERHPEGPRGTRRVRRHRARPRLPPHLLALPGGGAALDPAGAAARHRRRRQPRRV